MASFLGAPPPARANSAPVSSVGSSGRSSSIASLASALLHSRVARRARSLHSVLGGGPGPHEHGKHQQHPLMVSRRFAAPGADVCPVLLPDPLSLRWASQRQLLLRGKAAEPKEKAEEEAAYALLPPAARARGGRRLFLMGCACTLLMGYVAGKMAVMAASVGLMADLGLSARAYGIVAGTPALATVLFAPWGGRIVDAKGADNAAGIFAALVLLGAFFLCVCPQR